MKHLFLACIAACTGLLVPAQNPVWTITPGMSKSDQLFNAASPSILRHRFIIELEKGNRMEVFVHNKEHFLKLINIDSILQSVSGALTLLKDSLAGNELANRRIDYNTDLAGVVKIRTIIHNPVKNHYVLQKNELASLKVEQDTIVISGAFKGDAVRVAFKGIYNLFPYRIMLLLNNYDQLPGLINKGITGIMEQIRSEWNLYKPYSAEANRRFNLYGYYSMTDPSRNRRINNTWNAERYRTSIAPYVQIAVQAANGYFSPSVGAGIEFVAAQGRSENHYQLFWEPHFNFDHTGDKNKLVRNDFIVFQHTNATYESNDKQNIRFSQILSVGYLAGRKGNYFEKNTFKIGLPGARYKDVFLHPEFLFNDLFKNFQPSLKLMVYLD